MRANSHLKWIEFKDNVDVIDFMNLPEKVKHSYSITRMNVW
jgi:hypothetical protein